MADLAFSRRKFLRGLGAVVLAAPAVIRIPGLLMPIRGLWSEYAMDLNEAALENLMLDMSLASSGGLIVRPYMRSFSAWYSWGADGVPLNAIAHP